MEAKQHQIFALSATVEFGAAIATSLGEALAPLEEREFEDGEHKSRPLESVEHADAYVVQSLHSGPAESANDKLIRLLFFLSALKDAGAARVTAVIPYLCYARKDRRTKPRDPVATRYVAALFGAAGTDAVITIDVHNPTAYENAFRCRSIALTASPLFVDYVKRLDDDSLCVVSPDPGGVKRAELFREALEETTGLSVSKGFVDKRRSSGVVSGDLFTGDAEGRTALIIDDLISTGNTLRRAAMAVRQAGARRAIAFVTHGLFMQGSMDAVADPVIDRLVVTDTVPPFRLGTSCLREKIDVLPSASLFADVIRRLDRGRTLDDLLVL